MSWERRILEVFDDLEQQADGLALREREAQLRDLAAGEYAQVGLEARVRASRGREVDLLLRGGARVAGTLTRGGSGWAVVHEGQASRSSWLVLLDALVEASGLSAPVAGATPGPLADRLPARALLRRLCEEQRDPVQLHLVEGGVRSGLLVRAGADFVELRDGRVVATSALAAVRWRG